MRKQQFTYEQFMNRVHSYPHFVDGIEIKNDTDKYGGSIRGFYKDLMLRTKSVEEMIAVARQFDWLAADAVRALQSVLVTSPTHARLIRMLETGKCSTIQLAPFLVPHIMLWAKIIGDKYTIPEYWAAVQYMCARYFPKSVIEDVTDDES